MLQRLQNYCQLQLINRIVLNRFSKRHLLLNKKRLWFCSRATEFSIFLWISILMKLHSILPFLICRLEEHKLLIEKVHLTCTGYPSTAKSSDIKKVRHLPGVIWLKKQWVVYTNQENKKSLHSENRSTLRKISMHNPHSVEGCIQGTAATCKI